MCGIFAYIGSDDCAELLVNGLERLEYRGYDSAGIAVLDKGSLSLHKFKGRVFELKEKVAQVKGSIGIAHTRWATHGVPSAKNAHPHISSDAGIAIAHNGIIENHVSLKKLLEKKGYVFSSDTDSEVFAHLIAEEKKSTPMLEDAVRKALGLIKGAYGLVVIEKNTEKIVAARKGSPLVLGILPHARLVASDPSALLEHTKEVIYLEDDELVTLTKDTHTICSVSNGDALHHEITTLDWDLEQLEKGGFDYFMLKEIHEQPLALRQAIAGRMQMLIEKGSLSSLNIPAEKSLATKRIIIIACGTSWHSGLIAKHYFERLANVWVEVAYASELRYNHVNITPDDVVIAISQSGETADTLEALRLCKSKGAHTLGIVNVVGSSIAREVDGGLYLHAGPEIGVASTKAFTTQIVTLFFVALHIAVQKGLVKKADLLQFDAAIEEMIVASENVLETYDSIRSFASNYADCTNALYLGRGMHFPVALEGALKIKEISYVHAEGLPAAEMKHGPIALIDADMPVVVFAPRDELYAKVLSNIQEINARGGRIIVVTTVHDPYLESLAEEVLIVPEVNRFLQPIISIIPMQLLAYEIAVLRGCDVDKPRNLAKSVTVE